jgi:hypothetical protein
MPWHVNVQLPENRPVSSYWIRRPLGELAGMTTAKSKLMRLP